MKVANVEIKTDTMTSQVKVRFDTRTKTVVNTRFEEVRGYTDFALEGNMLIFYNVGETGNHIAYNQGDVAGFTTSVE